MVINQNLLALVLDAKIAGWWKMNGNPIMSQTPKPQRMSPFSVTVLQFHCETKFDQKLNRFCISSKIDENSKSCYRLSQIPFHNIITCANKKYLVVLQLSRFPGKGEKLLNYILSTLKVRNSRPDIPFSLLFDMIWIYISTETAKKRKSKSPNSDSPQHQRHQNKSKCFHWKWFCWYILTSQRCAGGGHLPRGAGARPPLLPPVDWSQSKDCAQVGLRWCQSAQVGHWWCPGGTEVGHWWYPGAQVGHRCLGVTLVSWLDTCCLVTSCMSSMAVNFNQNQSKCDNDWSCPQARRPSKSALSHDGWVWLQDNQGCYRLHGCWGTN